jgi:heptosyltransferase-2
LGSYKKILVIQTAFIGDVILTLPLVQVCKRTVPEAAIDFIAIPSTAPLLRNHPDIRQVIVFDKKNTEKGIRGILKIARRIKAEQYDLALIPHRWSAEIAWLGRVPETIGFDISARAFLLKKKVKYERNIHETERNLKLLTPLGINWDSKELPNIYPGDGDRNAVNQLLTTWNIPTSDKCVAAAPGSVWNTKRWLEERFVELCQSLVRTGFETILVGGKEDGELCARIQQKVNSPLVHNASGNLSLLESAELIRRCRVLVSNDSGPMHLAVAVRTPVIGIFGPTVPAFGFSPFGERDAVIEIKDLSCRPCSIHGGKKCPIRTFDCMVRITSEQVFLKVKELANG